MRRPACPRSTKSSVSYVLNFNVRLFSPSCRWLPPRPTGFYFTCRIPRRKGENNARRKRKVSDDFHSVNKY
ncbi:hypothetical protein E1J02_05475 [Phocaeicola dorei]|nr:hypothetical protein E1J05_20865 [Phocaeicola dorei]TDA92779.1 hypothetical protein E1J02_05475 [Phocaeicola dorei]